MAAFGCEHLVGILRPGLGGATLEAGPARDAPRAVSWKVGVSRGMLSSVEWLQVSEPWCEWPEAYRF